jgi:hypothetical protein
LEECYDDRDDQTPDGHPEPPGQEFDAVLVGDLEEGDVEHQEWASRTFTKKHVFLGEVSMAVNMNGAHPQ